MQSSAVPCLYSSLGISAQALILGHNFMVAQNYFMNFIDVKKSLEQFREIFLCMSIHFL